MEELFTEIAKDFSGKIFTKDDLMNKYKNNDIFFDKVELQYKKDIENYIKTKKRKSNIQTL
tara:strand:- start:248 stop:430 length:183 start_codon:yes stop_codon:yes gene_type:complete